MPPAIVLDTARLFLGAAMATPRGIDRVDLGYARHFFANWPGDCLGTLPTPWGVRSYDRRRVIAGLDRLEELWSEAIAADRDGALDRVKALLSGQPGPEMPVGRERSAWSPAAGILSLLSRTGFTFGASAVRRAPRQAIYLNVGQLCWAMPFLTSWLRHRPDIRPVFMVHDLIPLEERTLVSSAATRAHRTMMATVARHAAGIIVPTEASGAAVLDELRRRGRTEIAIAALPHPVAPVFLEPEPPDPDLLAGHYFLVCGTIEPRKNHGLLFDVWLELARTRGGRAPKLVLVGSRGRDAEPILARLAQSEALRSCVIFAPGISSPALRRLMRHAKAVLMPSLAEGFGLPVIEALAAGTPVIASSLAAHREAGGDFAVYLDPHDAAAWLAAISALADGSGIGPDIRRRVAAYQPLTTSNYFNGVERFLGSFDRT